MGSLKTVARNTDVTQRLEDPFQEEQLRRQQSLLRLKGIVKLIAKVSMAGLVVALLIFCAISQITNVHQIPSLYAPWMASHRITFPDQLSDSLSDFSQSVVNATQQALHKRIAQPDKHKQRPEKNKTRPK
jgi:hypothetical protein